MYMHLCNVKGPKTSDQKSHSFLIRIGYRNFRLEHEILIFGDTEMDSFFNLIITNVKKVIYQNRAKRNIYSIRHFETLLEIERESEEIYAINNDILELYKRKWDTDPIPTQLSQQEKKFLETAITKEELDLALSQMKNNKSPGLDRYSPEFFKKFWPQLGWFFLDSINTSFTLGRLPDSQTQGLITCIPKTGKARNLIKNWRPISLLNTSYKLISSCITNRMRKVLSRVISTEQKGFLEGRSISDCTRLMFDLINSCQVNNIDGLILLVDFEKAFDSLSWNFIQEALQKFNFGNNFIRWIKIFQTNSNSRISLNGHLSDPFLLGRGCRQGDPISPYLFILCSEFLTLAFKESNLVEGLTIQRKEHRLNQYADDTSLFLKASERNLRNSLDILQWFYFKSGLKINIQKTKVIRIGPIRETDRRFCRENNLDWVSTFTALGIEYNVLDISNIADHNILLKLDSMEKLMRLWVCRNITPIGRVTVFKSLVMSKIIHILQSLPTPSKAIMNNIEKQAINFVWKNKRHQVSKKTLCTLTNKGGLNMFNIFYFERSLKISWLHKLPFTEPDWKEFALCFKIDRLPWTGLTYHSYLLTNTNNPFWSSVISADMNWYTSAKISLINSPFFEPLWGNTQIKIPFSPVLFKSNFLYIRDLYNELGLPLTKQEIEVRMGQPLMFTTYYGIYNAIPANWKRMILNTDVSNDLQIPPIFHLLKRCKKGTSLIRSIWEKQSLDHVPIGQQKWVAELALTEMEDWCFLYALPTACKLNPNTIFFQF